ncbi:MAG: ATP--guanido phosphotransferase [Lachnospiraceae bacterium]|nr:ATP--guanido phosphotransferase [Lachnospiraceae bacterium]MCI8961051.1 ATP--guanido phosphotransferase [Lachnospiraceae bacterium]
MKWFEYVDQEHPGAISSRVRLVRNWDRYAFPSRLTQKEGLEMVHRLEQGLKDLGNFDGKQYEYAFLDELSELDRKALRERRIFNSTIASGKRPAGVILSQEEDTSIVLNGTDHIRIQLLSPGLNLEALWKQGDKLDDYVNQRFSYAFDKKYGYLTSFPTNMGTGMRASVVLHLPNLSMGKKFTGLVSEMGRFGASVKGVYGEGSENYGALFQVANQKTLGLTEKEIVDLVGRVATQLLNQERQVRAMALKKHRLECQDEAYKSYGVLKYARRLSARDAMTFLSQLMSGINDGLLETKEPCAVYRLMLGIQPANLQKLSDRPLGKEELDVARASYLRSELPDLV